jgi:molecular chaperone DnaJ
MPTTRDYYEVLGVAKTATPAEMKTAYRKKALEFHPDRNKAADAEEKFKEINEAYEILSDEKKRQMYDQFGHAAFDPRGGYGQPGQGHQQGPFTYTYRSSGGQNPFGGDTDFSDPFEIFEAFFGGGSPFGRQARKPHYSMKIGFMDAVRGVEKTVIHQGKEFTIRVPAGANDGTRIRFDEFDVSIDVQPHETFKRDGYDIFVEHDIPFTMAALGGTIEIPTVDKPIKLKVRPGTQPNTMVRLKSKGVKHLRGSGQGDQYVRLNVTIPESLTREQKKLLEQLNKLM